MKLAISSYSFHRFGAGPERNENPNFTDLVERCVDLGVDGLELLGVHFAGTEPDDLHSLKQNAFRRGIGLIAVSAHHNFVTPDEEQRRAEIDKLCHWVDVAHELGAPAVRAFGGRWQTRPKFAEFMAANGEEPPLAGYRDDDGYAWTIEVFRQACKHAEQRGVTLALENHWGFTGTAEGVLRILEAVDSPWLQVVLDTGNFNFCADPYAEMAALLPYTLMVHAKTYVGGGIYYTADLDYLHVASLLREARFNGYVSLEFEGRAHPNEGIPASLTQLQSAFAN